MPSTACTGLPALTVKRLMLRPHSRQDAAGVVGHACRRLVQRSVHDEESQTRNGHGEIINDSLDQRTTPPTR
jgi:hypothetical protein